MLSALSFTSPFILAALAALPAIWWLLRATPPSPSRVQFPAFMILRALKTTEETPDRTPWWLMVLRLLLAAIVIIGLAGPILNAPPPASTTGPLVFVIDDSWGAAANWRARRDALRQGAEEAVQSGRTVFMLTTAPRNMPAEIAPMTGEEARDYAANLTPQPFAADRPAALARLDDLDRHLDENTPAEIRWLTDGLAGDNLAGDGDAAFANALSARGDVTAFIGAGADNVILRFMGDNNEGPSYRIERLDASALWEGELVALARDGRELTRIALELRPETRELELTLDLPLALHNELASVRLENVASAGAVQLIDARGRRALVGLVADAARGRDNLLAGSHYLRRALGPYAEFLDDSLAALLTSDVSVIVLDDVGRLRASEADALTGWVERGGVLIRFAGPVLAEAAQGPTPPLLPVALRGGGRAFGGALTWDTPQRLDEFPMDGPFANLPVPNDVFVRQQVLAQPGGETTKRTWARLADGTPLVTGARRDAGVLVLFHITATPDWSDLPISGVFIEMLRRLTFLSALGPEGADDGAGTRYAPLRLMTGFGQLERPADDANALTTAQIDGGAQADRHPGLYGPPEAPLALNAVNADTRFEPISLPAINKAPYETQPPVRIGPFLFAAALFLLLADGLITLFISGRLRFRNAAAAAGLAFATLAGTPGDLAAQSSGLPLDTQIDPRAAEAALVTRLAYVRTGDAAIDRLSMQGLGALSRELIRRTSFEPGSPASVNPETDDLSVYPFLYWPIIAGAEPPSDAALSNIENFMRFGGMIMFDTRDDERAIGAAATPESQALRQMLSQLDIPPLTPVDDDHVLMRSFYLLSDLHGRQRNNPVWVQTGAGGANDGVTPIIIGGRDWAGAWASDDFGNPVKPMGRGGARARELSYRAGINVIMVALTGNYKSDQVHMPILLERLGK